MLKIREKIPPVNLYKHPVSINNTGFKPNFTGIISDTFNNSTGQLSFDSVSQAEKYAKENLGVNASFGEDLILANYVVDGLNDVKKAGFALPKKVIADYSIFKDAPKITEPDGSIKELIPARTSVRTSITRRDTIYLNPKYAWKDVEAIMSKSFKEKKLATDNPKHIIYHEVGHLLHKKANSSICNRSFDEIPTGEDKTLIEKYIGSYASRSYGEFVAECFVAKFLGKELPDKIDNLYKKWGGPDLSIKSCTPTGRVFIVPID